MTRREPLHIRRAMRLSLAAIAIGAATVAQGAIGDPPDDPCASERAALPRQPLAAGADGPAALDLQHPLYAERLATLYVCHARAASPRP